MRSSGLWAGAFALAWVLWPCPAATALDPIEQGEQIQAASAYMEARRAYEAGDYATAAQKIERAYVMSPNDPEVRALMRAIQQARAGTRPPKKVQERVERQVHAGMPPRMIDQGGREQEPAPGQAPQPQDQVEAMPDAPAVADAGSEPADAGEGGWIPRLAWLNIFAVDRWLPQDAQAGRFEVLSSPIRAGYQRFYKEGIGAQPLVPGLGFSARTEIYEEPKPVDGHITQAKQMGLNEIGEYKRAIVPIFTRSWAFRAVADYEPFPRFTYEFDKRHILHEYETRFNFKDRNLETHYFALLYSFPEMPYLGTITLQPGYKRVFQESDDNDGTFADIDEAITAISIKPTDNVEYFFQWNGKEEVHTKSAGYNLTHVYTAQLRLGFPQWKLFAIPNYEYSVTDFSPGDDEYVKKDIFVDWGMDITDRWRMSSKEQVIISEVSQSLQGNTNATAEVFNTYNKLSYELIPNLDVSVGLDYSKARGLNAFDNYGLRTELEYLKPGILRASVGYKWVDYYIINDELNLLFFKLFLFQ
jgi:hypothetical protein